MKKQKALSLLEVLLVMVIIGVIGKLAIPIFQPPDKFDKLYDRAEVLLKKATGEILASDPAGDFDDTGYCTNLINTFNTSTSVTPQCSASSYATDTPNFVTVNGFRWYGAESASAPFSIWVDVNGTKAPNTQCEDILPLSVDASGITTRPACP